MSAVPNPVFEFNQVARIPLPGDNAAIACQTLPASSKIAFKNSVITLPHAVLEGHRFSLQRILPGEFLLSWELPFGQATREIQPGDYICNDKILSSLAARHVPFPLPETANFRDHHQPYYLDPSRFRPSPQVSRYENPGTFLGYRRGPKRGVGTRNHIVVLGTTSLTGSYARLIASAFKGIVSPTLDGVVPVAHTEGGEPLTPNNLQWTLRTLAGFMVNPNVGAVLALDLGTEVITNAMLLQYMREHHYPLDELLHEFVTVRGSADDVISQGIQIVKRWIEPVSKLQRTVQPLSHLRLGLQCGGSDAFSGISGNPVVGIMSRELVRHGGSANLAETDELVGAEPYVLEKVRDMETAQAFLATLDRFQERVSWHRDSAEGNPSGGNNYRGLYNIAIKSIGAARKKDPQVRLDYVIEYGQIMTDPGFYFMDSPGNDLESIAGQVAAGCNMIVFTTGNGSITNFPFVPTIKIMTTSSRFQLLSRDMDINAGRYQDGMPMEDLGLESFNYMIEIASGRKSIGEAGGHSQVQLWREWRQTGPNRIVPRPKPSGKPFAVPASSPLPEPNFAACAGRSGPSSDHVGLIVPTSLCSGQIGRTLAEQLNSLPHPGISRFVSLSHTEGCGVSSGECEVIYLRTMAGYITHPMVSQVLLLEHGCEKTHNDAMRNFLQENRIDQRGIGWASIQMDGGIEKVTAKVLGWFGAQKPQHNEARAPQPLSKIKLGITAVGEVPTPLVAAFAQLIQRFVGWGGTVVLPQNASFLNNSQFLEHLKLSEASQPSLAYGQVPQQPGLHIMDSPSQHLIETLTGLGASGAELLLAFTEKQPLQSHPLVPLIQVGIATEPLPSWTQDLDFLANANDSPAGIAGQLTTLLVETASRQRLPKLFQKGNQDFQLTRGRYGVSL